MVELFFHKVKEYSLKKIRIIYYRRGDVVNNKIFFMTFDCSYSCNLKAISEEIIKRNLDIQMVWVIPEDGSITEEFPKGAKLVKKRSHEMFVEQASSKIWFDNALNCVWFGMPKKQGQVYINTWHGSMGIKKLTGSRYWLKCAGKCDRMTDYCVTNSSFEEKVFRNTFWKNPVFLKYGHPRNDILFDLKKHEKIRKKIYNEFGLNDDVFLCLYAPTFRDDLSYEWNNIDYGLLGKKLSARFGGEWKIVVRLHDKDRKTVSIDDQNIIDGNNCNIYDLMIACDVGVSDYSSWVYDYILLRKPVFIYASDQEKYEKDRGLYYPLSQTPFDISHNNIELGENILNFDEGQYLEKVDEFLKRMGCYEDGMAAKRVVDKIEEIVNN